MSRNDFTKLGAAEGGSVGNHGLGEAETWRGLIAVSAESSRQRQDNLADPSGHDGEARQVSQERNPATLAGRSHPDGPIRSSHDEAGRC